MATYRIVGPPQRDEPLRHDARLQELGVVDLVNRFYATKPPSFALKELEAIDAKYEGVWQSPGQPPSQWELEALQELYRLAGEQLPSPPPVAPSAPPVEPSGVAALHREGEAAPRETLPERDPDRHQTLVRWYEEACAGGAHNRTLQDNAVKERTERAGATLGWKERVDARQAAKISGKSGPKSRS
jgi:hypothetical protein